MRSHPLCSTLSFIHEQHSQKERGMLSIAGAMDTAKHTLTSRLADHFRLAERNTTVRTEVVGGVTTFAVMAYIIFLNPFILTLNGSAQAPKVPRFAGLVPATCLAPAVISIALGLHDNST